MSVIIGVDLGGTKMLAGAVDEQGTLVGDLQRELTLPEEGADRVIGRLADLVHHVKSTLPSGTAVAGISIGVPGGVNAAAGVVDVAPNLGWEGVPLAGRLQALAGAPVFLDNDVRVAVLGEHAFGVGRGNRTMVGVWVGTGIGGGIILDGKLWQGARGVAGEIGHVVVDPRGPACHCGNHGCIEALASRTAMERDVRRRIEKGKKSRALKLMKKKGRTELSSSIIATLLSDGDPTMTRVMEKAQVALGTFTASLVNILDPEMVVFGGGLAERLGEELVGPIRSIAHAHLLSKRDADHVRVVPTQLKETAPIFGAALLARQRVAHASPSAKQG